jgi:hypothetical protein
MKRGFLAVTVTIVDALGNTVSVSIVALVRKLEPTGSELAAAEICNPWSRPTSS